MKKLISLMLISVLVSSVSCERREGSTEEAGERVDEAVDNVKDGQSPFHKKGAGEKVGESIDKATGDNED